MAAERTAGEPARRRALTERGERRFEALVDAAAALLEEQGFAAVTHRAVAARAGLPLAATTYYFGSLDELVERALGRLARRHLDRARALASAFPPVTPGAQAPPGELAARLIALVTGSEEAADQAGMLLFYERYVQAGRRPQLRPLVDAWNAELVLGAVDHPHDPLDDGGVEALGDDLLRAGVVLDVAVQDRVEDLVGRQRVGVELAGPQLGGGRLVQHRLRDHHAQLVAPARQPVDEGLRHVADDREAARHVPVQGGVANRQLRLVAGGEHQVAELVRQAHQQRTARPRLDVLLGHARLGAGEELFEGGQEPLDRVVDRQREQLDAEVVGQLAGVAEAVGRGVLGRHGHASDPLAAERVAGNGRH